MENIYVDTEIDNFVTVVINGVSLMVWLNDDGQMDISVHDKTKRVSHITLFDNVGSKYSKRTLVGQSKEFQTTKITRVE